MNSVRTPYSAFPPAVPPQPTEPTPRERIERLKTLGRRALGYWRLAAAILVVGCVVSLVVALKVKLLYRSETTILFKPSIRTSDRPDEESPADRAQRIGAKLKDVLTTRARLENLIKQYDLYPKIVDQKGMVEAVDEMRNNIGFRARDSETYVISFENDDPETAQKVTENLATSMINEFTKSSLGTAKQESEFLAHEEERSAGELEKANKDLATFLTMHPEFAVEAKTTVYGAGAGIPIQPAVPVMPNLPKDAPSASPAPTDPQLQVLYRQKARLEAEIRNDTSSPAPVPAATGPANQELLARLTKQRDDAAAAAAAAQADLADKRTRLTDEHPDVISAKLAADQAARALRSAEVQLASAQAASKGAPPPPTNNPGASDPELQRRIARLNADIAARQAALKSAQAQAAATTADAGPSSVQQAVAESSELVQLETEWQRLLRVLHDVRLEHDDVKQRLEHARLASSAAEASGGDQMQVIDPAFKPLHPSKGGRTKTAMMGGVGTLLLALAYAFARVLFNDTIIDRADVEAMNLVPVLGVLPKVRVDAPGPASAPRSRKEAPRGV
jgi:uncharacterized protein involved in exopolysaccharide biosynthesis